MNKILTIEILQEYVRVLDEIDKEDKVVTEWTVFFIEKSIVVENKKEIQISGDEGDNKFIATALTSNVDYLVSGDEDLLVLKDELFISILNTTDFYNKVLGK